MIKKQFFDFIDEEKKCPYLPDKISTTHYKIYEFCSVDECEELILKGWRRFGRLFFKPVCKECNKCESIRVEVDNFKLSKSFRRVLNKNKNTVVLIKRPSATLEHLKLYDKYHQAMYKKKNWEYKKSDLNDYYTSFVEGYEEFGFELNFFIEEKLVAVSLFDIINSGISATYCYYDHDYQKYSLGTFSILKQIELAKKLNLPFLYLGFLVRENNSLNYKDRFKPYQILDKIDNNKVIYKKS